jgi:hypothetical protein
MINRHMIRLDNPNPVLIRGYLLPSVLSPTLLYTTSMEHEVPEWWLPYAAQFPRWYAWKGISGLVYARMPGSSPPLVARGEDAQDLADQIRREESQLEDRMVGRRFWPQSSSGP